MMKWLRRISVAVWIFCWYTVYREIFHWHHMTKTLRFNPPPPMPGMNVQPKAGWPVQAVRFGSVAAPLVFVIATIASRVRAGHAPRRPGTA
jgi:hypothetical protein